SLVTVVSRTLGYVRDQRITLLLGTTLSADAYVLAYRIPNLFRRLVAEGSMTASFIPVFSGYMQEKSREEVWDFANRLFWTLALVAAVISILGMVFSPAVVQVFTGANVARDQAVDLNRIIFPYLFFIALAALAMGILNCFHIFGLPRSEEHTSELQSRSDLVCRLLLEKKNKSEHYRAIVDNGGVALA